MKKNDWFLLPPNTLIPVSYTHLDVYKRQLLSEDGVILISIDDTEVARLVFVLEEIFGEINKEEIICWRRRHNQPNDKSKPIAKVAEFIVVFSKNLDYLKIKKAFHGLPLSGKFSNPDNDPRGCLLYTSRCV